MTAEPYYMVKVELITEDDNGKPKKKTEQYLVKAVSVTDAEVIITTYFKNTMIEYKVASVTETKIIDILDKDSANKN